MNELKIIANDMLFVFENEQGEKFVDARELHEKLFVGKDFTSWVKDRIEKYGFIEGDDFFLTLTKIGERSNVTRHDYFFTLDAGKEIAMVQNNEMGRAIRKYFIEVEKRSRQKQPQSIEDLIIMQAQSMKDMRERTERIERQNTILIEEQTTIKHRLDNIDNIDILGDLQQRFNKMVQRYAQQEGLTFTKAWRDFRSAYNTAYNTNLKAVINNYADKHGLKSLSMPQYFSLINGLEDAIRVADKMLNQHKIHSLTS